MQFINVDVAKLPKRDVALKNYLLDQNAHRDRPLKVVLCVEDDNPQGLLIYSDSGQLVHLYVHEDVRRSGIGTAIHAYYANETSRWDGSTLVHPDNIVAIHFLLSQGWRIYGKFLPHGTDIWHLRMTRKPTKTTYQLEAVELACSEFLESAMVFFSVGTKIY